MRTPRDIYAQYRIMPSLQLHQLRVAAVGKMVCDNFTEPINTRDVVLACLFHDMGNILKFSLETFPAFLEPEGLEYWRGVQREFREKYGENEHIATAHIAEEIGLSPQVIAYVEHLGFSELDAIRESTNEHTITKYADLRVGPYGVLSMSERLAEARERYSKKPIRPTSSLSSNDGRYEMLERVAFDIESDIFSHARIQPLDVTDESVAPLIEELSNYPVS